MKSNFIFQIFLSLLAVVFGTVLTNKAIAQSNVTIKLPLAGAKPVGVEIAADFIGLSYEMEKVLPDDHGIYYFNPANSTLIDLFKTLGVKSLRVGGNTADRPSVKTPSPIDIDQLFAFAKAADVKIIYTLRMRQGDPKGSAEIARYISEHYAPQLTCFAIGNEPNIFAKKYPQYLELWKNYVTAISDGTRGVKFCGPSATPDKTIWAANFANDMGNSDLIALITQHDYPGGSAREVKNPAIARKLMLSRDWNNYYQKFYDDFVPAVQQHHLPFRIEEVNSFYNGGAKDVSDTQASALWALDYMCWWAAHGASGINFHTGDTVAAGEENTPCRYAVFISEPNGYSVRPIGYAIKAFDLFRHGRIQQVDISNPNNINLTSYVVVTPNNSIFIVLINKELDLEHNTTVKVELDRSFRRGEAIELSAINNDPGATSGVTLAGESINNIGIWHEDWKPLPRNSDDKDYMIKIPAASALIIKLSESK